MTGMKLVALLLARPHQARASLEPSPHVVGAAQLVLELDDLVGWR